MVEEWQQAIEEFKHYIAHVVAKNLGTQGWEGKYEFNDVEEKGWKYCPYCGEKL